MEFIRGLHNIRPKHFECVATIGNFDGLHGGHQKVIQNLLQQAKHLQLPATVITFEPLPLEYFAPDKSPARLLNLREKILAFKKIGVERVLCLRFNQKLADLSAEDFVKNILVEKLGVRYLIVGDDFCFGKGRQGDFDLLCKLGKSYGFEVANTETVLLAGERVGSSRVRQVLAQGDFSLAKQLLDRPYSMNGRVAHGDSRGRQLGFPTANIALKRQILPLKGVFAVRIHGLAKQPLLAVANIGARPTVDGKQRWLEVHLLDFNQDIYGKHLEVEFVAKLRDEQRFSSLEELKAQIAWDVVLAREKLAIIL